MPKSLDEIKAERAARENADAKLSQNGHGHAPPPRLDVDEPEPLPEERPAVLERSTWNRHGPHERGEPVRESPHSSEAEKGVLGSMIKDPARCVPMARQRITPSYFYVPAHQIIFGSICALFDTEKVADPSHFFIALTGYLRDAGQLETVGGASCVTDLYTFVPTAANIDYYLDEVRDKYVLREIIRVNTEGVRQAYDGAPDVAELVANQQRAFETVRAVSTGHLSDVENFNFSELMEFDSKTDENNLLGYRWLCRGFTCLWAAAAGAGKSSLAMQLAIYWGNGLSTFGIKPVRPLKSLIIQAENDLGDAGEQLQGVMKGIAHLDASLAQPRHKQLTEQNVIIKRVIASTGMKFCALLETLIQSERPDFVWIDPLFAFAGCDLKDAREAQLFIREGIFPIAIRHGVCLHVIHHVGKPDKDSKAKAGWTDLDFQYLGFGSSEIQNAFRAVNIMIPVAGHEKKFRMILAKRGSRAGAKDPEGEFATSIYLGHSAAEDGICWVQIDKPEEQEKESKSGQFSKSFNAEDVLAQMSAIHGMKTGALQRHITAETGMSRPTFYRCFEYLKKNSKIKLSEDGWVTSNSAQ